MNLLAVVSEQRAGSDYPNPSLVLVLLFGTASLCILCPFKSSFPCPGLLAGTYSSILTFRGVASFLEDWWPDPPMNKVGTDRNVVILKQGAEVFWFSETYSSLQAAKLDVVEQLC